MTLLLAVDIPGQPVAKGRPIFGRTHGGRVTVRTPGATLDYEHAVATIARHAWGRRPPLDEPVRMVLTVVFARPKSAPKRTPGRLVHDRRPDLDNVVKAILDGLQAGGVIADDGRVAALEASKWYAAAGEAAGVRVEVHRIGSDSAGDG